MSSLRIEPVTCGSEVLRYTTEPWDLFKQSFWRFTHLLDQFSGLIFGPIDFVGPLVVACIARNPVYLKEFFQLHFSQRRNVVFHSGETSLRRNVQRPNVQRRNGQRRNVQRRDVQRPNVQRRNVQRRIVAEPRFLLRAFNLRIATLWAYYTMSKIRAF